MSKIVDFNKEKDRIEAKKEADIKRKKHNDKVIRKYKNKTKVGSFQVWQVYLLILVVITIGVLIFR